MREMSASEASRNFSSVLDNAEDGETVVVTRGGKQIAVIAPAPRANGAAVLKVLERWRGHEAFDEEFEERIASIRRSLPADEDTDPWLE